MKNPAAQSLGRLGGLVKSKAKAEASRRNGRLSKGRPKNKKPETMKLRDGATERRRLQPKRNRAVL